MSSFILFFEFHPRYLYSTTNTVNYSFQNSDPQLNEIIQELKTFLMNNTLNYTIPLESDAFFFSNSQNDKKEDIMLSEPTMGKHRPNVDAIFSFVSGYFEDLVFFILSARKSGFDGDIVVNIQDRSTLDEGVMTFLEFHSKRGVVVYEGYDMIFTEGTYEFRLEQDDVALNVAKFE